MNGIERIAKERQRQIEVEGRVVAQVFTRRIAGTLKSEQRIESDPVGEAIIDAIIRRGNEQ